jgi:hypothetical protein
MTTKINNLNQTFTPKIDRLEEKTKEAKSTFTTKVKNLTKQDKGISNKLRGSIAKLNDSTRAQAVLVKKASCVQSNLTD